MNLRRRRDIVIKPADKGSTVVVISKEDYINKVQQQLNDTNYYQKLNKDPTSSYITEIRRVVTMMFDKGLINKNTKNFLIPDSPRIARLYLLPKLHKPGVPGRPIVSSNGSPTENISRFVDHFLRPCTAGIPSYIRDTTDFLNKLKE